MPPEDEIEPKFSGPVVWISVAFAILLIPLVLWWPSFASETLRWDDRTVETVSFSAMAVLCAFLMVAKVKQHESEKDVSKERKFERANSILIDSGLILILASLALSANRAVWNLPREVYFGSTLAASLVYLTAVIRSVRKERRPIHIFFLMVAVTLLIMVLWRYFSGAATLGGGD
ncbi:MAG: hypothetical protein K8F91_24235 [Candidatus Obscuribacterales bacterium]|nr:hypothetical protein [Candidatus Obscuribacterales bacterium]